MLKLFLNKHGGIMPRTENILNSLKYLKKEAQACGSPGLSEVINVAINMAEMVTKLEDLYDNHSDDQDIMRVMTFIKFYRTAPPHIQKQVYAMIAATENSVSSPRN
jgi:hypothetical protein